MKKFIAVVVCAILIIISGFLCVDTEKVVFGKGRGVSESIRSIAEVGDVLESVELSFSNYLTAKSNSDEKKQYESATIFWEATEGVSVTINSLKPLEYTKCDFYSCLNMNYCFTQNATYIDMDGYLRMLFKTKSNNDREEVSYNIKLKAEMYIESEHTYIRYSEFSLMDSNSAGALAGGEILNKWIDVTDDFGDRFLEMNESFQEYLATIGKYLRQYKDDGFTSRGNIYEMKANLATALCSEFIEAISEDLNVPLGSNIKSPSFKLNLINNQKPIIESDYIINYNFDEIIDNNQYYYDCSVETKDKMTLSNINNTIVSFDKNIKIYNKEDIANLSNLLVWG